MLSGRRSIAQQPEPPRMKKNPQVSVVVVVHNMQREAERTLYSLSAEYQRDIDPEDYEIIVVDNGSNPAFDTACFEGLVGIASATLVPRVK